MAGLVFVVAYHTALRFSEIYLLRLCYVSEGHHSEVKCLKANGCLGLVDEISKTTQGWWEDHIIKSKKLRPLIKILVQ